MDKTFWTDFANLERGDLPQRKIGGETRMEDVIELGAHQNMSPEQALSFCLRENWDEVLIVGIQDGQIAIRSSKMTCRDALYLAKQVELHALGL